MKVPFYRLSAAFYNEFVGNYLPCVIFIVDSLAMNIPRPTTPSQLLPHVENHEVVIDVMLLRLA